MSDDGAHAITIIALLGSVFSPFYAKARAAGPADPLMHCSMNVALYARRSKGWALTERPRSAVERTVDALRIGPSTMGWRGDHVRVDFDERTAPFGARLAGSVRLWPEHDAPRSVLLDAAGRHVWSPVAPTARATVELSHPAVRFCGSGYMDANGGDEPLDRAFQSWSWSRAVCASSSGEEACVTYDVRRRDGSHALFAGAFGARGERDVEALAPTPIGRTVWGLDRRIPADPGSAPRVVRTLEDGPFYARTLASASFGGRATAVVHEELSLDRFSKPWVQRLLPYRMRREG